MDRSISKSPLLKQVDNSSLEQLNYDLWNSFDPPDGPIVSLNSSSSSSLGFDDDPVLPNPNIARNRNENSGPNNWPSQFSNSDKNEGIQNDKPAYYGLIVPKYPSQSKPNELCTLYIDMTYDDRVFFGVYNYFVVKDSISKFFLCNIDFSTEDNRVSIQGPVNSVMEMCDRFFNHSTYILQYEMIFSDKKIFSYLKQQFKFFKEAYERVDVYVTYRQSDSNKIIFNFLTFRKCCHFLYQIMLNFQIQLEFYQLGKILPSVTTSFQIPMSRKDHYNNHHGINNAYIERIEKTTKTKIIIQHNHDCVQYKFDNVIVRGANAFDVMDARKMLTDRFECQLKFQISIPDIGFLVRMISGLEYDRNIIDVNIEPQASDLKMISIRSNEKNIDKIFILREKLFNLINIWDRKIRL